MRLHMHGFRLWDFLTGEFSCPPCPSTLVESVITEKITLQRRLLLPWKTKKNVVVSHSSAETELRATTLVTTEVTWLWWLLENFGISVSMPTPLLSDSTWAISIVLGYQYCS
jgi:hypothetical protein